MAASHSTARGQEQLTTLVRVSAVGSLLRASIADPPVTYRGSHFVPELPLRQAR